MPQTQIQNMSQKLLMDLRNQLPRKYRVLFEAKPRPVSFRTLRSALQGEVTDPAKLMAATNTLLTLVKEHNRMKAKMEAKRQKALQ
jgi:hypothetical protein